MVKKITKSKIISCFINDYGKRFYLREIAKLFNKPHQTIKPYVEELVNEEILIKNKRGNMIEFSLNFRNKKVYDYIVVAEKEFMLEKTEDTLLKILYEKLSLSFKSNTFIIFGSSVKKVKKNSDIDLLIIGKGNIEKIIEEFQEVYNKKIHQIQIKSLGELNETLIKEIYKKHIIFNNTEQIIRFFGEENEQNKLV